MKTVNSKNKTTQLLTSAAACIFVLAGCSSSDDPVLVTDPTDPVTEITVSGVITDFTGVALTGVTVQGVYISSTTANPTILTDTTGAFSLTLDASTAFYLNSDFSGYTPINSEVVSTSVDITDLDIGIPRGPETEEIISLAFPGDGLAVINHAWLAVDIEDENGNQVGGETITSSVTPSDFVYTDCDGNPSGGSVTIACPADRDSPMYIAYFDTAADATVTVDGQTKIAPLRVEQATVLEYEVAAAVVVGPSAGQIVYDNECASCHKAGSYDIIGTNSDVIDTGNQLIADVSLSYLHPQMASIILTQQEVDDLAAFLDVEITP